MSPFVVRFTLGSDSRGLGFASFHGPIREPELAYGYFSCEAYFWDRGRDACSFTALKVVNSGRRNPSGLELAEAGLREWLNDQAWKVDLRFGSLVTTFEDLEQHDDELQGLQERFLAIGPRAASSLLNCVEARTELGFLTLFSRETRKALKLLQWTPAEMEAVHE